MISITSLLRLSIVFVVNFLFLQSSLYSQGFSKLSLEDAFVKASTEKKKVLAYFTAKWCGPCNGMNKQVFSNDTIKEKLQEFVAIKIDVDTFYGGKLMKEYQVAGMPTFIILEASQNILSRHCGYLNVTDFAKFLACTKKELELADFEKERLKKRKKINFVPEFGVRFGLSKTTLSNIGIKSKTSGSADLFFSLQSKRFLLRQGIGYASKGNQDIKLDYLQFPLDIGFTFYKPVLFGLPDGVRLLVTPYYARLLNQRRTELHKNDFGLRYGISYSTTGASKLELILCVENGMTSVIPNPYGKQKQQNRSVNLSFALTF